MLAASEMLNQHRSLFAQYWAWNEDFIAHALNTGVMHTPLGWECRTGITEFNTRSIGNWPIQGVSADILRIAVVWAHRRGIRLLGTVHDAALIESPIDRIEADVALMQEIMRRASRVVLGAGKELRTSAEIVRYPDSYFDKRGVTIWQEVMKLLAQYCSEQESNDAAANVAGSLTSSGKTRPSWTAWGQNACKRQNLHDRSRRDDSTKCAALLALRSIATPLRHASHLPSRSVGSSAHQGG
jgi:hypothetical protein